MRQSVALPAAATQHTTLGRVIGSCILQASVCERLTNGSSFFDPRFQHSKSSIISHTSLVITSTINNKTHYFCSIYYYSAVVLTKGTAAACRPLVGVDSAPRVLLPARPTPGLVVLFQDG